MYVKICGVTNMADALAAARLGADYVGLIRAASARRVTLKTAGKIAAVLPTTTRPVLLFQDATIDEVLAELGTVNFNCIQLHGREPVSYIREIITKFPEMKIIRAWQVSTVADADGLNEYLQEAANDGIRFETVILDAPKGGPHPGYKCLGQVSRCCRKHTEHLFCAGGLTPDNLTEAVRDGSYDGVDVACGVEQQPGVKDHDALKQFITLAKALRV